MARKFRSRFLAIWKVTPPGSEVSLTSCGFGRKPLMIESVYFSGTKMARMISVFRAHKRVSVIFFSWVAFCALMLIPNWRLGPFYFLFFSAIFVMLIASQLFWVGRVVSLGERF